MAADSAGDRSELPTMEKVVRQYMAEKARLGLLVGWCQVGC